MPRHVAFLRGINLGNRRVKMADLRRHFRGLAVDGVGNVSTFLASGNVIFDHPGPEPGALEEPIESQLEEALGFRTRTLVRPMERLAALVGLEVVERAQADGFTPYVTFVKETPGDEVEAALASLETPDDAFHVLGREVLWLRRGRLTDSSIETRDLQRAFGGVGHTRRKLNTVRRIVEKFA